jgi:hypothetical protein
MDSPVNLIGPGDVEELAEMIGNEGFELVEARVTIEPRAGAATDVKDLHPLVGRMASPTAARAPRTRVLTKCVPGASYQYLLYPHLIYGCHSMPTAVCPGNGQTRQQAI